MPRLGRSRPFRRPVADPALLVPPSGGTPVGIDAIAVATPALATAPLSWAHTCSSSATLLLVIAACPSDADTSTATYNGVSMTSLGFSHCGPGPLGTGSAGYIQMWALASPPTGASYNVVVTNTPYTPADDALGASISFTGAVSAKTATATQGANTPESGALSVASAATSIVVFAAASGTSGLSANPSIGTKAFQTNGDGNSAAGNMQGAYIAGGSTEAWTWVIPDDWWGALTTEIVGSTAVSASGQGSLTLSGSGHATVKVTAQGHGTLNLTGSGHPIVAFPAHGTGTLALSGSAHATVKVTAQGHGVLNLSGTGHAVAASVATGHGTLTLTGSGHAVTGIVVRGTGSLTLAGSGHAVVHFVTSGTGVLTLSGTGLLATRTVASGAGPLLLQGNAVVQVLAPSTIHGPVTVTVDADPLAWVEVATEARAAVAVDTDYRLWCRVQVTTLTGGSDAVGTIEDVIAGTAVRYTATFADIDGTPFDPEPLVFTYGVHSDDVPDLPPTIYTYGTDTEIVRQALGVFSVDLSTIDMAAPESQSRLTGQFAGFLAGLPFSAVGSATVLVKASEFPISPPMGDTLGEGDFGENTFGGN